MVIKAEGADGMARSRVAFAIDWLERRGVLDGRRSHRLSARVSTAPPSRFRTRIRSSTATP